MVSEIISLVTDIDHKTRSTTGRSKSKALVGAVLNIIRHCDDTTLYAQKNSFRRLFRALGDRSFEFSIPGPNGPDYALMCLQLSRSLQMRVPGIIDEKLELHLEFSRRRNKQ